MGKRLSGVVAFAVIALTPSLSQAQATLGPTLAWNDDFDFGIGAQVEAALPDLGTGIGLMADFVLYFPDGPDDYFELNGNLTYDFPLQNSTAVPFLLSGLNFARISPDTRDSDTEVGLNVGGGIRFDAGKVRPTIGGKFVIGGRETFTIFATLPFKLGS